MSGIKQAHHRGTYQVRAKAVTTTAYANPHTRCWRCGLTLAEILQRKPRACWTAGHVNAGEPNGLLLAECSPCNYGHGARLGNTRRRLLRHESLNTSRRW